MSKVHANDIAQTLVFNSVSERALGKTWTEQAVRRLKVGPFEQPSAAPKVHVSTPFVVEDGGIVEEVVWGAQWVTDPAKARSRTKLYVYDLGRVAPFLSVIGATEDVQSLRAAMIGTGITGRTIAVPFKWDTGTQQYMDTLLELSGGDAGVDFAFLTYREILEAAGRAQVDLMLAKTADESEAFAASNNYNRPLTPGSYSAIAVDLGSRENSKTGAALMSAGIASFQGRQLGHSNIGFDRPLRALESAGIQPIGTVITTTDIYGRDVGREVAGWPVAE